MGKGIKRAAKNSKDFAKKKAKVGRKLDKANNDTTVDVRVRQLNLPSQHALDGNDTVPTDESNHSLKVCCPHTCHTVYSAASAAPHTQPHT